MNKKEISEIKKQYTPKRCCINRICGCYVNQDREKVTTFSSSFLMLEKEEQFKYFELFRKTLSGTLGKVLHNMEFPLTAEQEDGIQLFWMKLRESQLKDETLLEAFYDKIIATFPGADHYLILLLDASYDIPGKASDNLEMEDASEEVFHYLHCCICPVLLSRPALSYDETEHCFRNRLRDWIVEAPALGLLFPSFNDRSSDIHSLLCYAKKAEDLPEEFTSSLLACQPPLSAGSQKELFSMIVEDALGEECDYETVRSLHEQLHELAQSAKDSPDPVILGQADVKNLLARSGASIQQLSSFEENVKPSGDADVELAASNIICETRYEVRTPDVEIRVSPDRSDLVETRLIDGRPCLVIPITDEILVNGIHVKPPHA